MTIKTIKTISLAGEPGRPYLWHQVRQALNRQIEPGSFATIRTAFSKIAMQLSELDSQTEFGLYNELLTNIDEENAPY